MLDLSPISALTFDCYGTLIDWETGILRAVRPILSVHGVRIDDAQILREYAALEAQAEAGEYQPYREVLRTVMRGLGSRFKITLEEKELDRLPESIARWPAFPDTPAAMKSLSQRFRLAIISNIDEDLFEGSLPKLGVEPERLISAELCRSYKPSLRNFKVAMALLDLEPSQILHVAQSRYHDIAPARSLGLKTVWINRPSILRNQGVAPAHPANSEPDLELPDLASLARLAEEA